MFLKTSGRIPERVFFINAPTGHEQVSQKRCLVCCVFEQLCLTMPRFSNKLETLRDFLNTRFKKISRAHWHASTARMGALTRMAIGIRRKRNERQRKQERQRKAKKGKERQRKANDNNEKVEYDEFTRKIGSYKPNLWTITRCYLLMSYCAHEQSKGVKANIYWDTRAYLSQ